MADRISRSVVAGHGAAVLGVAVATVVFFPLQPNVSTATVVLAYLLVVLFVATIFGRMPAMVASVMATLAINFFFLPPILELTIADPQNWVALAAFLITAVTAGNLAERAKRAGSAYSRNLIEAAPDPLVTIAPDGRITDANAATENATGYPRSALIGTDFSTYFTDPEKARIGCRQVFEKGLVQDYALELRHRDGHIASVLYNASVYRDRNERVLGAVAVARDLTVRQRAEEQVHHLAQLQARAAELGQDALRGEPLIDLLNNAGMHIASALGVDFSDIAEMSADGESFLLRAGFGWKEGLVGHAAVNRAGSQPGYTIERKGPVIIADAAAETRFRPLPLLLGEECVSAMSVVIATTEGPYGALGVHSRRQREFTPDEVNFLQMIANVLGMAIERMRAEQRLHRLNRAHRALSMANQALVRATAEDKLLQHICQIIVEQAGYRLCWVGYAQHDEAKTVRVIAETGVDEGYLQSAKVSWADTTRGRGPTGTCIRTGELQIVRNFALDTRMTPWQAEAAKRGYASSIAIPLIAEGKPFGAMTIYSGDADAFGDEEVELLGELSGNLGYGIATLRMQTARKQAEAEEAVREREIAIGFRIQQMLLLDEPPTGIPGVHIAAISIPSQRVAGDFYQFFAHKDESVDIIVADVMGKGVPAALLGAATKSHFNVALCHLMALSQNGVLPDPRDIVTLVYSDMAQHLIELESFVTLCYARVNLSQRRLDFVDCGHTGLVHLRAGGACDVIHGDNLPLGIRADEIYHQISIRFDDGDILLFYSDGVTEAADGAGEQFGTERLVDCARRNAMLGPEGLAAAIRAAVAAFAGSERLTDDLTCVAIRIGEGLQSLVCRDLQVSSALQDLRRAREFVRDFCATSAVSWLSQDGIAELELAVSEAASNIMKHVYAGQPDRYIRIEVEALPNHVVVRLHYAGDSFNPSQVPPPVMDGSRESGFGIYLITNSVDDVYYYKDAHGESCIELVKNRK